MSKKESLLLDFRKRDIKKESIISSCSFILAKLTMINPTK